MIERICIGHDVLWTRPVQLVEVPGNSFVAHSERVRHPAAIESMVKRVFGALQGRGVPEVASPQIPLPCAGGRAPPAISPVPGPHATVVAVCIKLELERHAARTSGRLLYKPDRKSTRL